MMMRALNNTINIEWKAQLFTIVVMLFAFVSQAQNKVDSGELSSFEYQFLGGAQYAQRPALVHALAYTHSSDVQSVKASLNYKVRYQVERIPHKGFRTDLYFVPQEPKGFVNFYKFNCPEMVLPDLASFRILVKSEDVCIYAKTFKFSDSVQVSNHFSFTHQRYSKDWEIIIDDIQWKFNYSEEEFVKKWDWFNDYQSAVLLLNAEMNHSGINAPILQRLYDKQYLEVLKELCSMDFYQNLVLKDQNDPELIKRKIDILEYSLNKEIMDLEGFILNDTIGFNMEELAEAYTKLGDDILQNSLSNPSLYSDLYFEFNPKNINYFCFNDIDAIFNGRMKGEEDRVRFEKVYQALNINLISQLIEEKLPSEALFQIERLEVFYQYASYLQQSSEFSQFKSKAVYDIYLSYVQVARQAIAKDRTVIAMTYLDQASLIQGKYPSDIINDIYVEKELQNLIKKALDRYKDLLENGEHDDAQKVKKGILGLMKRYSLNWEDFYQKHS